MKTRKIKLNKVDINDKNLSKEIFDFLNENELGVLCGGATYANAIYYKYVYSNYAESTYYNKPIYIPNPTSIIE